MFANAERICDMSEPLVIKKKGEDGYKVFSVRVREDIVKRVDEMAAATNHSRNELIGKLLEYAIDNCRIE